jgi:uncharacterized membrane protein YkvA (DUF1232 family)
VAEPWKGRARKLKNETRALYLASRDPRVPRRVRWLAFGIVAYALSPVDLIPDFIPVLGYLDDLVLIPLGIYVLVRLIPADVMRDCRERAARENWTLGRSGKIGALLIVLVWIAVAALAIMLVLRRLGVI